MRSGWLVVFLIIASSPTAVVTAAKPKVDGRLAPLPQSAPAPADNPTTPEKVALGKQLFFDPRLSGKNSMSCASCHMPDRFFGDGVDWNKGEEGFTLVRNTPSCMNVGFYSSYFWDGRAASLEEQALGPIQSDMEMNQSLDELEKELSEVPGYVRQFQAVFHARPNRKDIGKALAAYQRTLVTEPSPFDRYLQGDENALSADAKRGFDLFVGEARCIECHNGPMLSDGKYYRMGISQEDIGREAVTGKKEDRYKFRTPSLRNIAETGPYMHNGLSHSLESIVLFYYRGTSPTTTDGLPIDAPDLQERSLAEVPLLLAFLQSLSGKAPDFTPPTLPANRVQDAPASWHQWRGPTRDGLVAGNNWPKTLTEKNVQRLWRVELPPSYSGPIVTDSAVFVTGTADMKNEIVMALDRKSGRELWRTEWPGAMLVPFFAMSNGSWIRSTPCFDGESLFVAGIRDVLVSLDAKTGQEKWRLDFVKEFESPLPAFGFVSSPLLDGDSLYVQAGASLVKLDKQTGKVIWRVLKDEGGMMGSAFSSPVIATLAGQRQLVVQTREKLAGVDLQTGAVLWEQKVPNFRGMNILTPVVFGDGIFTSAYQNKSWFYDVSKSNGKFEVQEAWNEKAQGYMSTPVVIDGHAYIHLQNERFACINLTTGERTWTSKPYGKYCSLVAQKDLILALDETGTLLLIKADPKEFELLGEYKVSDEETWAHLAVYGNQLFVRELNALSVFRWDDAEVKSSP